MGGPVGPLAGEGRPSGRLRYGDQNCSGLPSLPLMSLDHSFLTSSTTFLGMGM